MSSQRLAPGFKDEAVRQVLEGRYPVSEVAQRLGVSAHSLYKRIKMVKPNKNDQQATELVEAKSKILRLRAQLRRTEEERDTLKRPPCTLPGNPGKVRLHQRARQRARHRNDVSRAASHAKRLLRVAARATV